MVEKDSWEKIKGLGDDYDQNLGKIFGKTYWDTGDRTKEGIPSDLQRVADNLGGDVANISYLVDATIERTPKITCQQARQKMCRYLREYISQDPSPKTTIEDSWAFVIHGQECHQPLCRNLHNLIHMDKYWTAEQMKVAYDGYLQKFRKIAK